MLRMFIALKSRLATREEGQSLVEYALILGLISVVSIGVLGLIGVDVNEMLEQVENALGGDDTPAE
jgi:Flp pilus assembly pilin Flp